MPKEDQEDEFLGIAEAAQGAPEGLLSPRVSGQGAAHGVAGRRVWIFWFCKHLLNLIKFQFYPLDHCFSGVFFLFLPGKLGFSLRGLPCAVSCSQMGSTAGVVPRASSTAGRGRLLPAPRHSGMVSRAGGMGQTGIWGQLKNRDHNTTE